MTIITKRSCLGLAAAAAIALSGCGGSGGSDSPTEGMGVFNLSVSDAGIDAAKVCIQFYGIQLKKADEDAPMPVENFEGPVTVNLLDVQGANSRPIWSDQVPAGNYEWIRLLVDAERDNTAGMLDTDPNDPACLADDGSYIVTEGGVPRSLFIPSGNQSGLKLIKDINVPVNSSANYTAEWDLGRSFIAPPGLDPVVKMRPVVKLMANNEVGTLVGQVADDLVMADSCDAEFAPKVYVFNEDDEPNEINDPDTPDENDPEATGLVELQEQDDGSMQYRYSIGFLLAGNYDPVFTCDGITFVTPYPTDQEGLIDENTTLIEVGQTTTVNFDVEQVGG